MAKNYRDDFDYSEAIANTQDAAERQELLAERQNKIDAEGLAGKVASNDAVATWNGDYRPYSVSSRGGSSSARSEADRLYDAAEQARLKRFLRYHLHFFGDGFFDVLPHTVGKLPYNGALLGRQRTHLL